MTHYAQSAKPRAVAVQVPETGSFFEKGTALTSSSSGRKGRRLEEDKGTTTFLLPYVTVGKSGHLPEHLLLYLKNEPI